VSTIATKEATTVRFANVRELKNKTSELLRYAQDGKDILITSRGKPVAILRGFSEDELEDYVIANHPDLKAKVAEAYQDYLVHEGIDLDDLIAETEKELGNI
jgi:prevent-host-death family protein